MYGVSAFLEVSWGGLESYMLMLIMTIYDE